MISTFRGKYHFLSNFYTLANPIIWETIRFPTSEHLFVAYKTMSLEDRIWISTLPTPGAAKAAGSPRGYQGDRITLRGDWEHEYNGAPIKVHVMRMVLLFKYQSNPILIRWLCATHPQQLVEGNKWNDNYWGNCTCPKCIHIPGQNLLGRLHMEHRDTFMTLG